MDPVANWDEMIETARSIQADFDREMPLDEHSANRLAELIIAFYNWRMMGGYDPFKAPVTR